MTDPYRQAYLREYKRLWMARRRAEFMAGKSCVDCGSTARLEIDHVNPATKISHRVWSWRSERRLAELAKCVVRCRPCHDSKTWADAKPCGTVASYDRGCRCDQCRAASARDRARYGRKPRAMRPDGPVTDAARWVAQAMARRR